MATSSIEFQEVDLFADLAKSAYSLVDAQWGEDASIIIESGGSVTIQYVPTVQGRFACEVLKQVIDFNGDSEVSANFAPKGYSSLDIQYTNIPQLDNNLILINRDSVHEVDEDIIYYTNNAEVKTQNREVQSITVLIKNGSDAELTLYSVRLYKSQDLSPLQIVDVLNKESVVGEIVSSTSNFTYAQFVQYLQTNVMNMTTLKSLTGGNVVNYIEVQDYTIRFRSAVMSTEETEQFMIPIVGIDTVQQLPVFHAVAPEHPLYGDAFTIRDPRDKFPSMSDIEYEKWKLMVWKKDAYRERMAIRFRLMDNGGGTQVENPVIVLGEGVANNNNDPDDMRGRMQMYVDYKGGHLKYTDVDGQDYEIVLNADGIQAQGLRTRLTKLERYDNGCVAYFLNDPDPTVLKWVEDEDGLRGIEIDGKLALMPRFSGNIPE